MDTNGDSIISPAEAEVITSQDVTDQNIADMSGIELFVNLDTLYCYFNQLTRLNVSNNTALKVLWCGRNRLTNLDISTNTALTFVALVDMPSLHQVCVWEMPFPPDSIKIDTSNSPNVYFTADCN